jgi:hypothetical protein
MINRKTINEADCAALEEWAERVASLMLVDAEEHPFHDKGFYLGYDNVTRFQNGTFTMLGIRFVRRIPATGTTGWTVDARDTDQAWTLMKRRAPERVSVKLLPRSREEQSKISSAINEYQYHLAQVYLESGKLDDALEEWRCITNSFPQARKSALGSQIFAARASR